MIMSNQGDFMKIPIANKTHFWFCRNCNAKNKESEIKCYQCEVPKPNNPMRRAYK